MPALSTLQFKPALKALSCKMPSASGLRQIFPRQTIKIFMAAKIVCSWQFAARPYLALANSYCRLPILLLWIFFIQASHFKSIAMTNKEILQANLLDILFENRNKAYGAYALRRNYNHRLQWALGISLSFVLSFIIFAFFG